MSGDDHGCDYVTNGEPLRRPTMSGDVLAKANRLRETLGLPVGVELMDMCGDAADEIERLRAGLFAIKVDPHGHPRVNGLPVGPHACSVCKAIDRLLEGEADDE